jgi:hypothetical protein
MSSARAFSEIVMDASVAATRAAMAAAEPSAEARGGAHSASAGRPRTATLMLKKTSECTAPVFLL